MLGRNSYTRAEIDVARGRMDRQLATYRALGAASDPAAIAAFEQEFFVNLVLALDQLFVHRLRKLEAKEPALRRVREIAAAATSDSATALTENEFTALADEFLAAVTRVYPSSD